MAGEGIFFPHEVKGAGEFFGGDIPGDQGPVGEIDGHERLANAANGSGAQHGDEAFVNGGEIDSGEACDFREGCGEEAGDFVFGDREDLGVDRIGGVDGEFGGGGGGGKHGSSIGGMGLGMNWAGGGWWRIEPSTLSRINNSSG